MRGVGGGRAACLLAVVLGAVFGAHRIVDPDVFQHVAVGRWILNHPGEVGRSPFHDLYPDRVYVEDKPLSQVAVALAERMGGEQGLALYQLLLPALVAAAWFGLVRSAGADPWTSLAAVALALPAAAYRLEPRPDTLSHALLALTITALLRARPSRLRFALPLLFVLWVNLHGYWTVGWGMVALAALAALLGAAPGPVGRGPRAALQLAAIAALCLMACLVHPQGWRAVAWPLEQLRLLREHPEMRAAIVEFFPGTELLQGLRSWHVVLTLSVPVAGAFAAFGPRPWSARARAILGALCGLVWLASPPSGSTAWPYRLTEALTLAAAFEIPFAIRGRRYFPALAWAASIAMAVPMVRNLTLLPLLDLWVLAPGWSAALAEPRPRPKLAAAIACALLALAAWARVADRLAPGTARAPGWTGFGIARDVVPVAAAEHLRERPPRGRTFNDFQSGGVLLAALPGRPVFIAGNTSLYPPEHLRLYREQILTGRIGVDELPARFGIDTVVLEHASLETPRLLAALSRSASWRPSFLDEAAVVFRWKEPALDVERVALAAIERESSRSPLPGVLLPARRLFPALNLGIFLRAYGRPDLALPLAERLWREGPTLPLATFRAAAAEEAGLLGEAVPFLEEAVRALGDHEELRSRLSRALFFRAVSAMVRGQLDPAERDLARASELRPLEPGPWIALARISATRGEGKLARERLERARSLPGSAATEQAIQADPLLRELR